MQKKWKWVLGLTLVMVVLITALFAWRFFLPYGMMGNTNAWYMPMMYGPSGVMASGMMFLVWLILLGLLILIGLGIAWLIKSLTATK